MLNCSQQVVFHSHKQPALLPRILQIQRLEVVTETSLPGSDHGNQTEVAQLFVLVKGSVLALENDSHVELLDDKVHHLPG